MNKQKDRPDREREIDKILWSYRKWVMNIGPAPEERCNLDDAKSQIIALFPDELEYNPDYLDFQKGVEATRKIWKVKVKEAKREERERIVSILEKNALRVAQLRPGDATAAINDESLRMDLVSITLLPKEWQALKGE